MNAYLFSGLRHLCFYSLEAQCPVGAKASDSDYANLLTDIRESMDDIFPKAIFHHETDDERIQSPSFRGNAPLDHDFHRKNEPGYPVGWMRIGSDGTLRVSSSTAIGALAKRAAANPVPGVRITFRRPEGKTRTLVYLSVDVSDKGLAFPPRVLTYLSQGGTGDLVHEVSLLPASSVGCRRSAPRCFEARDTSCRTSPGLSYRAFGEGKCCQAILLRALHERHRGLRWGQLSRTWPTPTRPRSRPGFSPSPPLATISAASIPIFKSLLKT